MADKDDEHTSPANPDNRIELERVAADEEHKADIVAHPAEPPPEQAGEGAPLNQTAPGAAPRRTARKVVKTRAGRKVVEVPSTGHSWDGIEEYDNPLPRWWLWTFYATVVWAIIYTILYPAWPMLTGATQGTLGYSTRGAVAEEIQRFDDANAPIRARLVETPLDQIGADQELASFASNAGQATFRTWCAQCHGAGAGGFIGYPNLRDNVWLWGGSLDEILYTVTHGIRSEADPDTHFSEMPRYGRDQLLDDTQIRDVAHYVLSLSGQQVNATYAAAGEQTFVDNCTSCHAEDGTGDRLQGAPDLTDNVWLYGGSLAQVQKTIHDGPFGVMPNWGARLSEADIRAVTYYVHSLGGGE